MQKKTTDIDVLAAAYLHTQQHTEVAIGQTLGGLSQTVVSRLIKSAKAFPKELCILETKTTFVREHVSDEDWKRVEARIRPTRLQELLSRIGEISPEQPAPVVYIYPSYGKLTSAAAWRHRIDEFSKACAMDVLGVLDKASVIGVSWGDMVATTIAAMKKASIERPATQQHVRTIVPLLGEPLGGSIMQHSSSVLAARLEEAFNPDLESVREHRLSLAPVAALIPFDMNESEIKAIRKMNSKIPAYKEIFGGEGSKATGGKVTPPLIDRIDAVLTSLSTQEGALNFANDSLLRTAGIDREKLNELVIGDLCGALIERPNLNAAAHAKVEGIRERWTGVTLKKLKGCADRAKSGGPGIVLLAIGANKAPLVYAAIRRGLVQHLFTDQDLASQLEQICAASA